MENELADSLSKEATKEKIDSQEEFYEEADKKEIISLMKGSIVDKWQRMFEISEHTEKLQEIILNVENVTKYRGEERRFTKFIKVRKRAKLKNRYNQAPHLTQDTNGKVTTSQLDFTIESKEGSPFSAGDHKALINRRTNA